MRACPRTKTRVVLARGQRWNVDIILVKSPMTLGILARNARLERHLSQSAAAARAGVSRSWLSRVEDGHPGAELAPLLRLMEALDLRLALHDVVDVDDTDIAAQIRDRRHQEQERSERVLARITARHQRDPGLSEA